MLGITILAASSSTSTASPLTPLLFFGVLIVGFYFLLIRPQRRQQQQQRELANNVDPGDQIVTLGGIFGTITEVDDDEGTILLEVAPGVEIRMLKQAVSRRVNPTQDDDGDADGSTEDDGGSKRPALGEGTSASAEEEADDQR